MSCNIFDFFPEPEDSSGGGGGDKYSNSTPTPATIGGISAGSTFNDKTMSEMWNLLLYPYQSPTFTAFSINNPLTLEVGDSVLADRTFTWSTSNSSNIQADSIVLRNVTDNITLASGIANDGSETVTMSAITKNTITNVVFRILGTNTSAGSFQRDLTINWLSKLYYGESLLTSLTESDIESLRVGNLQSSYKQTYNFNSGGYKYICYPTSLGTISTIKDESTGFDVPFNAPITVSVTNSFAISSNYYVYRSTNILNSSLNLIVT